MGRPFRIPVQFNINGMDQKTITMKKLLFLFLFIPAVIYGQDDGKTSHEAIFSTSPVHYAAIVALSPTYTYSNGTMGAGAKLTATGNGWLIIDGDTVKLNDRVLIALSGGSAYNGTYICTTQGTASVPYVLTRTKWGSIPRNLQAGTRVPVDSGTTLAGSLFVQVSSAGTLPVIGTTPLNYIAFHVQSPLTWNPVTQTLTGGAAFLNGILADSSTAIYVG